VLVQYSCVQVYYCLCVTVMGWYSTVGYRVTVVCVTVICWCSTVGYRVNFVCVCYCNVLLQYSWYRVTVVCVLL